MPTPEEIIEEQLEKTGELQSSLSKYIKFLRRARKEFGDDRLVDMDPTEKEAVKDRALVLRTDVKTKAADL
jgi:hypothetical protein